MLNDNNFILEKSLREFWAFIYANDKQVMSSIKVLNNQHPVPWAYILIAGPIP